MKYRVTASLVRPKGILSKFSECKSGIDSVVGVLRAGPYKLEPYQGICSGYDHVKLGAEFAPTDIGETEVLLEITCQVLSKHEEKDIKLFAHVQVKHEIVSHIQHILSCVEWLCMYFVNLDSSSSG